MNRYEDEQWDVWAKKTLEEIEKEEREKKRERRHLVRVRNRIIRGIREDAEACRDGES